MHSSHLWLARNGARLATMVRVRMGYTRMADKVPKRMPRSRSNCFFHVFFQCFGAKMSLCCRFVKAACISARNLWLIFSLRKASHCWSSAFLINPPDIRQKKSRYDLVWYIESCFSDDHFWFYDYQTLSVGNHSEDKWHPGPRRDKALSLREMEVDSPLLRPCFQGMNVRGSVDRPFKHGCKFPFCDSFLYLTFPFTAPFFTWLLLLQLLSLLDCSFSVFLLYFTVPLLFFTFWKFLTYTSFDDD